MAADDWAAPTCPRCDQEALRFFEAPDGARVCKTCYDREQADEVEFVLAKHHFTERSRQEGQTFLEETECPKCGGPALLRYTNGARRIHCPIDGAVAAGRLRSLL